jgi:outer membrane protein assembly factor BamB
MAMLLAILTACNNEEPKGLAAGPVVQITGPSFVKSWQTQLRVARGEAIRDIYLIGDTVHIETDQNFDHALRAASGELEFFNQVATPEILTKGAPALLADAFVIARGQELYVYTRDGRFQKTIDLGFTITNQPVAVSPTGSQVIVGLDEMGGRVAEIDVSKDINPSEWEVMTNGLVDGAVAVSGSGIYAGSEDGSIRAFFADRSLIWPMLPGSAFKSGGQIVSDVRADHPDLKSTETRSIYFGATDGVLYCVDCGNGKLRWRYFAGTPLETAPEVTLDSIYQYVPGKGLVALDRVHTITVPDGEVADVDPFPTPRWTARNGRKFLSQDDHNVYALSSSGSILALDKQTGRQAFESHIKGLKAAATNLKNATIYAVTRNGVAMSLQPVLEAGSFGEVALASPR